MDADFTTIEHLQMEVSNSYGVVLKYNDRVFVADCHWKGGYYAEVYEFIETPEESGVSEIECRLSRICVADEHFPDNGHAIAWCITQK